VSLVVERKDLLAEAAATCGIWQFLHLIFYHLGSGIASYFLFVVWTVENLLLIHAWV